MIQEIARVELRGVIIEEKDLSGLVVVNEFLLIGSDEGKVLQMFSQDGLNRWRAHSTIKLGGGRQEADLEAIGYAQGFLYATGSHSRRRRTLKPGELSARKNRKRFAKIDRQKSRYRLYRIPFDARGVFGKVESISLAKLLKKDSFIGPFSHIPSKENGVDIEGLTISGGLIYLGFRGPVLRYNLVPVWILKFDDPKQYQQIFVDLGGQGIRDLVALANGFLVLSGPVSDAHGSFKLWFWDGVDQMPGVGRTIRPAKLLGELNVAGGVKAEGITLLEQSENQVDILLVHDSAEKGRCTHYRVDL